VREKLDQRPANAVFVIVSTGDGTEDFDNQGIHVVARHLITHDLTIAENGRNH
jgi:hypothetical protein